MGTPIIEKFNIAKYQIILEALGTIRLPPYAGSTLRGAFGSTFKAITCTNKTVQTCSKCEKRRQCTYFQIYENSGEFSQLKLTRFKTPPKPFVFDPPMQASPQVYEKGQVLAFNLVLIGRALKSFPYFIIAFKEMGLQGIGKGRGTFSLKEIHGLNDVKHENRLIYSSENDMIMNENTSFNLIDFIQAQTVQEITIKRAVVTFVTPTRIKSSGSYGNPLNFKVLIQTLLTRISNLAYSYCDQKEIINFRDLVNASQKIEVVLEKKQWQDVRRFQTQNNMEMFLGGYIGEITYEGELNAFWPWLKLGETLHLGKNCAFGLGKFTVAMEA